MVPLAECENVRRDAPMDNWLTFWKLLLIAAFVLFGVLAIAVTVGGFFDIRAMFKSVDAQHQAEKKHERPQGDPHE